MPEISIIVPIYKTAPDFLKKCIQSVLEQTQKDIELILVDDGSPDNCGKLCDEYTKKDSRVVAIHKPNGGTASARNAGLGVATGKWIQFLDADDWLEKDTCEKIAAVADDGTDIIQYSAYKNYTSFEHPTVLSFEGKTVFNGKKEIENLQKRILGIASGNAATWCLVSTCIKAYRHKLLSDNNLTFDESVIFSEDSVFNLYALEKAEKVICLEKCLYHYRYAGESKSNSFRKNADSEQMMFLNAVEVFLRKYKKDDMTFCQYFYERVMISFELLMSLKYYNEQYRPESGSRRKELSAILRSQPYAEAFKKIKQSRLSISHRVKYYLIKARLYGVMSAIRKYCLKRMRNLE